MVHEEMLVKAADHGRRTFINKTAHHSKPYDLTPVQASRQSSPG